ncbi:MAG TPA: hypothetical protein VFW71_10505 [Actinomycetota bacterium]|nr:hypothetical protein [Actinomycetota bacterium]
MAYVEVVDVAGGSMDVYHQVEGILGDASRPGLIAVAAGATPVGMAIVSIWDSKQSCEAFISGQLGPALAQAGAEGSPNLLLQLDGAEVTVPEPARA